MQECSNRFQEVQSIINIKAKPRVNGQITSSHVRLITDTGDNVGVVAINIAMEKAKESSLDLVEVAPDAQPPVCKIMDYNRFYYELRKKIKGNRKKSKSAQLKQIRVGPNIGKNDLKMKFEKIMKFLEGGHKVKINMRFRGRQAEHLEVGREILNGVINRLEGIATCQSEPKTEGLNISVMMIPTKEGKHNNG